jgi:hypothetical protein
VGPAAESLPELSLVPRSLETSTKRGFPHSHSDYGDDTRSDGKANPAKIAGRVGFLHRTLFVSVQRAAYKLWCQ